MHSNLKKRIVPGYFSGDDSISGNFGYGSRWDTAEAAKMPGVGIEAVLKDFYSQNREIKG